MRFGQAYRAFFKKEKTIMEIGDNLLPLTAPSTLGTFDLSAHKGRWVVLYFYPKDNTSGCTLEAKGFTAAKEQFAAVNTDIVGISRDSLKSHEGFCTRQELTIELASDKDEALCNRFDVIKDKVMYGRKCRGVVRSTFLVDPEGKLAAEWRAVKVPGHVEAVLAKVKELQAK